MVQFSLEVIEMCTADYLKFLKTNPITNQQGACHRKEVVAATTNRLTTEVYFLNFY